MENNHNGYCHRINMFLSLNYFISHIYYILCTNNNFIIIINITKCVPNVLHILEKIKMEIEPEPNIHAIWTPAAANVAGYYH